MPSRTFSAIFAVAVVFGFQAAGSAQNGEGAIAGQIRAANGRSAVSVRVAAMPVERILANDGSALLSITETDTSGRYRLANLPPGRYYALSSSSGMLAFVLPTTNVCTGDVCTTARPGRLLNEPSAIRSPEDSQSFGLLLPVGEHPVTFNVFPPEFGLLSATYGSTDLLKEPLRILDIHGEIPLTFKRK